MLFFSAQILQDSVYLVIRRFWMKLKDTIRLFTMRYVESIIKSAWSGSLVANFMDSSNWAFLLHEQILRSVLPIDVRQRKTYNSIVVNEFAQIVRLAELF